MRVQIELAIVVLSTCATLLESTGGMVEVMTRAANYDEDSRGSSAISEDIMDVGLPESLYVRLFLAISLKLFDDE